MNYQELIHTYIDGGLQAHEEAELFSEMSHNSQLRIEFQEQMRLHRLAHSDMAATAVPPDITSSVFDTLGMPLPSTEAVVTNIETKSTTGKFPFIPVIYTALLSSLISAGIMYYFMSNNNATSISTQTITEWNKEQTKEDQQGNKGSKAVDGDTHKEQKIQHIPKIVYRYIDRESEPSRNTDIVQDTVKVSENISEQIKEEGVPDIYISNAQTQLPDMRFSSKNNTAPLVAKHNSLSTLLENSEIQNFSIIVRSMPIARYLPSVDLPNQNIPDINNIGIGLHYDLSENHSLGIEGGRELFSQEFTRVLGNQTVIYRQNPSLYWYGIAYRFSASDLSIGDGWLTPYAQGFAGWAQNGPLVKLAGGLRLLPETRISLFAGLEFSRLYYPVQAVYFSAEKYSFVAGASIRF